MTKQSNKTNGTAVAVANKKESNVSLSSQKRNIDQDSSKLIKILEGNKPYHEKLAFVKNELEESVREINFNYTVHGFLEDAAYALHRAVEIHHGFTRMKDEKSASKNNPPEMIDVRFADGKRIKVPFGTINLPQFGKNAFIEMRYDNKAKRMLISGTIEKRYSVLMDAIVDETQSILHTDSIYKNKAIKYDGQGSPEFIDLSSIDGIELFLTPGAQFATEPIEARIERHEDCLAQGIDLKFGVLLEGSYGTGKTLYANKLAAKAIANNWTFIYCSKPEATLDVLKIANKFTKNGVGVVLFIEDIDKVLNERNNVTNEISLLMDGSETKHNNIISIFSTNHIENIDPTFLRGKRIGSIVTLAHLDAGTAENMMKYHLASYLKGGVKKAAKKVEEYEIVPAFLSEIIDRVKTHTVLRTEKVISEGDILNAIEMYKRQMDIAKVKIATETDEEAYMRLQKKFMKTANSEATNEALDTNETIDGIYNAVGA